MNILELQLNSAQYDTPLKLWHNTQLKSVSIIIIFIIRYINMHTKAHITSRKPALSTTRYQKKIKK